MLRTLLIGLMFTGALFSQDEVIVKKVITLDDATGEMTIDATVKDHCLNLNIDQDGKCLKYKVDLDNLEELEAIDAALKGLKADVNIKAFAHDEFMWCSKSTFLGVKLQDLTPQLRQYFKVKKDVGVLVSEVLKDTPAEKVGVKAGDVIVKVGDTDIYSAGDLTEAIMSYDPGDEVLVSVNRRGRIKKLKPTLAEKDRNMDFEAFCLPGMPGKEGKKMKKIIIQDDKCLPKDGKFPHHLEGMKKHQCDMEALKKDMEDLKKELEALKK